MSNAEQKGQILVYSIVGCPHCLRAKSSLQQHGLIYLDVSVDMYAKSVTDELRQKTGGKTSVPQIFFNDRYIGGNSDLQGYNFEPSTHLKESEMTLNFNVRRIAEKLANTN